MHQRTGRERLLGLWLAAVISLVALVGCVGPEVVKAPPSAVAEPSAAPAPGDAVGVYGADKGVFLLTQSANAGTIDIVFDFLPKGGSVIPIAGDWNGDGRTTVGVYNPKDSAFHLTNSTDGSTRTAEITFAFGKPGVGLIPLAGDWDGDGKDSVGIYDPKAGVFLLRNDNSEGAADAEFRFGARDAGMLPVAGDWDGDGKDAVGLYDPATALFRLKNRYGAAAGGKADVKFSIWPKSLSARPLAGDWEGDGTDSVGWFIPDGSTFYLKNANSGGGSGVTFSLGSGKGTLMPVSGDW